MKGAVQTEKEYEGISSKKEREMFSPAPVFFVYVTNFPSTLSKQKTGRMVKLFYYSSLGSGSGVKCFYIITVGLIS